LEHVFDKISAEDVTLFLLKQAYKSLFLFLRSWIIHDIFCRTGSQPIWLKV